MARSGDRQGSPELFIWFCLEIQIDTFQVPSTSSDRLVDFYRFLCDGIAHHGDFTWKSRCDLHETVHETFVS